MQFLPVLRILAVLRRPGRRPQEKGAPRRAPSPPARGYPGPPAAHQLTTGDLINRLSQERLTLYRQGSGHPIPREVRARLVEIVRELDRLWELRRHELASTPLSFAAPSAPRTPNSRTRSHRQVA